jgi:hypothetical protein
MIPKYKYKLIRPSRDGARIWEDEHSGLYIADSSGDRPGHVGRPDETDDGPLMIDQSAKRLTLVPVVFSNYWSFPVMVMNRLAHEDPMSNVVVDSATLLFLADKLEIPMELKLGDRRFALVEANVAARTQMQNA